MEFLSNLISPAKVEAELLKCLKKNKPCSLIRINDGENRMLAYNIIDPNKWKLPTALQFAGVEKPNEKIRQALIQAIKQADIVGLATQDNFVDRPLCEKILNHFQLTPPKICDGNINLKLYRNGGLKRLIKGRKVLLLGRTIHKVIPEFHSMGAQIVGAETVEGFDDIPRVLKNIKLYPEFDLALVAAGIPAKILCIEIKRLFGKVAIDIGHVPEKILYPKRKYREIIREWLAEHSKKR